MTKRSQRRAAEMAVINDASAFAHAIDEQAAHDAMLRLLNAVEEYEALGLAQLNERGATNHVDTSNRAAASLPNIAGMALRCFDEIALAGGLTVDQLEALLNGKHQTISARVNDLMEKGWIVDSGIRRKTRSGRDAIVWRPSEQAVKEKP